MHDGPEIEEGKEPLVPYSLHSLVRMFYDHLGTNDSILLLKQLKNYKDEK